MLLFLQACIGIDGCFVGFTKMGWGGWTGCFGEVSVIVRFGKKDTIDLVDRGGRGAEVVLLHASCTLWI